METEAERIVNDEKKLEDNEESFYVEGLLKSLRTMKKFND